MGFYLSNGIPSFHYKLVSGAGQKSCLAKLSRVTLELAGWVSRPSHPAPVASARLVAIMYRLFHDQLVGGGDWHASPYHQDHDHHRPLAMILYAESEQ
jgi:hypothetical protein